MLSWRRAASCVGNRCMTHQSAGAGSDTRTLLTINCGSSSIKFAMYVVSRTRRDVEPQVRYSGSVERIGEHDSRFEVKDADGTSLASDTLNAHDHAEAVHHALGWLEERLDGQKITCVGHRLVHGGAQLERPQRVTTAMLEQLRALTPLAPLHLPVEIAAIEAVGKRYPDLPQIACFDTAFHRTMPREAQLFGLPRHFADEGIIRYGFHGLSYEYIVGELDRESAGAGLAGRRIVVAHLGNGASMAAIRDGHSVDTTMGLTPIGGLVMSTRSGDIDPGALIYLLEAKRASAADIRKVVEQEGGLLGISATSSDMQDLLKRSQQDERAAEAVSVFCHSARRLLGGLVSVLGGLHTLVFTGGIGERAAEVRSRICAGQAYMGVRIDAARNAAHAPVISDEGSSVTVRVMHTNEELMIARHSLDVLDHG